MKNNIMCYLKSQKAGDKNKLPKKCKAQKLDIHFIRNIEFFLIVCIYINFVILNKIT